MPSDIESVQFQLSKSEALVLFDWLAKIDEKVDDLSTDQAEQHVIWKVEGLLESALTDVLASNYHERLNDAKQNILGMND
jgi:hypothetical protein